MNSHWKMPVVAVAAFALAACNQSSPLSPSTGPVVGPTAVKTADKGNGSPSGAHYNLNIIGTNDKSADMDGSNGHRIFVKIDGNTKIMLTEGADFQVLDANGTDGTASFQLPNPDPTNSGTTRYSVFARALGKPGGGADVTTCAEWLNPTTGLLEEVCSLAVLELRRSGNGGKSSFTNVSKELLYIYADVDGTGIKRYPLFDSRLQGYLWDYENSGLRLAQLRFYPCPTTVPEPANWSDPVTTACFN